MNAFLPKARSLVTVVLGATPSTPQLLSQGTTAVRVVNDSTATMFVCFGRQADAADVTKDIPVKSGVTEVLTAEAEDSGQVYVSAIVASGSPGSAYFTPGEGV